MTAQDLRENDRRLEAIADILARGVLRCFVHEELPPQPPELPKTQRFRIVEERVVTQEPLTILLKFEFTTPRPQRAPRPPRTSKGRGRLPHATVQLARAYRLQQLLDQGEAKTFRQLAKHAGVSAARVTQILDLLFLAPDIQEEVLFFARTTKARDTITERDLRMIAGVAAWPEQRKLWADLRSGSRVRLIFQKPRAARERWHPTQQTRRVRRGVELSMKMRPTAELARRILALGKGVEVLAPESLREQVAAELRGAASRYAGSARP